MLLRRGGPKQFEGACIVLGHARLVAKIVEAAQLVQGLRVLLLSGLPQQASPLCCVGFVVVAANGLEQDGGDRHLGVEVAGSSHLTVFLQACVGFQQVEHEASGQVEFGLHTSC